MKRSAAAFALAAAISLPASVSAQAFNGGLIGTCTGSCGTSDADGDVTLSGLSGSTAYGWVSTSGGLGGVGQLGAGGTNGSLLSYSFSTINPNTTLAFKFQFVTSDGTSSFPDYGWAQLIGGGSTVNLFNARTTPTGNTVPGFGLPPITATINPLSTPIIAGQTTWSPLGGSSGDCYQGITNGCGRTGWFTATYTIAAAGTYALNFGVTNAGDLAFDSGLAFDFTLNNGVPDVTVPEPMTATLLAAGLAGIIARRRRNA